MDLTNLSATELAAAGYSVKQLTPAAVACLDKLQAACGFVLAPWQRVRMAEAEAKAAAIMNTSAITLSENQRKGLIRTAVEAGQDEENLHEIVRESLAYLQEGRISGETDWERVVINILGGEHDIQWQYSKDKNLRQGLDRGWVDEIQFDPLR